MPVVLCGCDIWSLAWKEGNKLIVFQNRMPRKIFGPKREEVTGNWRKFHTEELHDLYSSLNICVIKSRNIRWAGHVERMREIRGA